MFAVALRIALYRWKMSKDERGRIQNAKWNALKAALRFALSEATGEIVPGSREVDYVKELLAITEASKCYFETELDRTPPEKSKVEDVKEMQEDEDEDEEDEELEELDT